MVGRVDAATRIRIFQPGPTHILVLLDYGISDTELTQFGTQHNTVYTSAHDQHIPTGKLRFFWGFRPVNIPVSKAKFIAYGRRILWRYCFTQAGTHHSYHQVIIGICQGWSRAGLRKHFYGTCA